MNDSQVALCILLAVGLAACGSSGTLGSGDITVVTPLSLGPPPIYSLIGYRAELNLTSDQVTALDSIAQVAGAENQELVAELRRASERQGRQVNGLVVTPETEPILEAIRANQREAGDAVAALLNEDQEATVCRLFEQEEEGRRRPQNAERNDGFAANGWQWCT